MPWLPVEELKDLLVLRFDVNAFVCIIRIAVSIKSIIEALVLFSVLF